MRVFSTIKVVYKRPNSTKGAAYHQVYVIDEVGPATVTNLCFVKGHNIDYSMNGEVVDTGK